MPKIETEEQFLDLAEKFQKDYCLLRNHVVNMQNQHLLEHPFSSKLDTLIDLYLN